MEIDKAKDILTEAGIDISVQPLGYYLGDEISVTFTPRQIIAIAQAVQLTM